jgi:hypothetical protein
MEAADGERTRNAVETGLTYDENIGAVERDDAEGEAGRPPDERQVSALSA